MPLGIESDLAGMTRLELANQLIENQSAFHFAFIPMKLPIGDCRLSIGVSSLLRDDLEVIASLGGPLVVTSQSAIGNWKSAMSWCAWRDLNSSQS